ncbi:response regulator transcription factor [Listeria rocourtiae]|uniref:LytR/AlgR family response regulator transcription factor n=1 Tax=Listeria rocourtiae TaxID=647910 RepID=UPI001624B608|nr:LytTR family DNA-binding domain-containing protein [Listeria rocourtiae]MBC1605362.1 response regulator transcription factor [Listeria rocourtiae]
MNIYILDDNFLHREYLNDKIGEILVMHHYNWTVKMITDLNTYKQNLSREEIGDNDVFFIDIDLGSYFNGIDLATMIRHNNSNCFIIFVTNDSSRGTEVINKQITPFAYLVKENNELYSIRDELEIILSDIQATVQNTHPLNITLSSRTGIEILDANLLNYISAIKGNRHTCLIRYQKENRIISKGIGELKDLLPDTIFFKGFKSYIINIKNISSLNRTIGMIHFKNRETLELSPRMIDKLTKILRREP